MLYPLCNYVLFMGTLAVTATQYCFKQQEQLRHQIFFMTISHKLDCKDQILYFSTYAKWSSFAVCLELLILFICLSFETQRFSLI